MTFYTCCKQCGTTYSADTLDDLRRCPNCSPRSRFWIITVCVLFALAAIVAADLAYKLGL